MGFVHSIRAQVAYERMDLATASAHARQALELLQESQITLGQERLYGLLAQIEQQRGSPDSANRALERALQIARGNDVPRLVSLVQAMEARVRLAQGALHRAARWADAYAQEEKPQYLREYEELTLAGVRWAQQQSDAALAELNRLLPPAETNGRWGTAIEALVLHALALDASGRGDAALASLRRALERAEPEGYVRPFVEEGLKMRWLLSGLSQASVPAALARHLDRLLAAHRQPSSPTLAPCPPQTLVEPLTAREHEVLDLLAKGLTNAEIGQRLVISLPTVKSHTRNLYGKLGVHSRRAAVRRARDLGLLTF
jgi:LuxR family maltose regulon positive regulatory protein